MENEHRILVVDDRACHREFHREIVEEMGCSVEEASDGLAALLQMELGFDLVLLDVQMPAIDGFEVLYRMRHCEELHSIPVIMITGLSRAEYGTKARKLGADEFFSKPVDEDRLRQKVEEFLVHGRKGLCGPPDGRTSEVVKKVDKIIAAEREIFSDQLGTIHRMALATGYDDRGPWNHMRRVGMYCCILGESLDLSSHQIDVLRQAAPLHDVGKVGVPDHVLTKPDGLIPEERKMVEEHPLIGASILRESPQPLLRAGECIVLHHHEKWDGTGYPEGLEAEEISLLGRICAVADVFDALTTERPYRDALSVEEAVAIMKEGRGRHFDPEVYDVLVENMDVVFELRSRDPEDERCASEVG